MRILIVDDDEILVDLLTQSLRDSRHIVDIAEDGEMGWEYIESGEYELILLDIDLPRLDGVSLCEKMRSQGYTTPILLMTAKDASQERIRGLDAGADDYLVKPFELRELLARVRALLRRSTLEVNSDRLKVGNLELDLDNQVAYRGDKAIDLSEKEIKLLTFFMQHQDRLLTHEEIYSHLWQADEQPSSNVLAALVRLLRRKIEIKNEAQLIHTVYGKGYRFGLN